MSLERAGRHLDVKGNCWTAAFPSPNITVALQDVVLHADQFDETFEATADSDPRKVDFLGNGIDCGFRIASRAAPDRCTLSLELAWLLAEAKALGLIEWKFNYHGRHPLKGVLKERPYPIFSLDTERDHKRKELRAREAKLTAQKEIDHWEAKDFLVAFMDDHGIERPHLEVGDGAPIAPVPYSYEKFSEAWQEEADDLARQKTSEQQAERPENAQGTEDIPENVLNDFATAVAAAVDARQTNEAPPDTI